MGQSPYPSCAASKLSVGELIKYPKSLSQHQSCCKVDCIFLQSALRAVGVDSLSISKYNTNLIFYFANIKMSRFITLLSLKQLGLTLQLVPCQKERWYPQRSQVSTTPCSSFDLLWLSPCFWMHPAASHAVCTAGCLCVCTAIRDAAGLFPESQWGICILSSEYLFSFACTSGNNKTKQAHTEHITLLAEDPA